MLRSFKAERRAGYAVVATIFASACLADALIGLAITAVILRSTWQSFHTVRNHDEHTHTHEPAAEPIRRHVPTPQRPSAHRRH